MIQQRENNLLVRSLLSPLLSLMVIRSWGITHPRAGSGIFNQRFPHRLSDPIYSAPSQLLYYVPTYILDIECVCVAVWIPVCMENLIRKKLDRLDAWIDE